MREELIHHIAAADYLACDLIDGETLVEYRKRIACPRRRWWRIGRR